MTITYSFVTAPVAPGPYPFTTLTTDLDGTSGSLSEIVSSPVITVTVGALDHIVISPDPATIAAGATQAYTAEGFDSSNNSLGDVTGSTTFTISGVGTCNAVTKACGSAVAGPYTVTGTDGVKTDTATLNVNAARPTVAPTEVVGGETATPTVVPTEVVGGETATPPATSTSDNRSNGDSMPLFALLICLAFGSLAMLTVQAQRCSIRR
jgi:hypothetical protein